MRISKTKVGLLALPLLTVGAIGAAAFGGSHTSAAPITQPTAQTVANTTDTPEPNDTADATEATEPKGPDTDNIQEGP
jgi:hypothetical protein